MTKKTFRGTALTANKIIGANYIFPRFVLEEAVAEVQGKVADRKMIGHLSLAALKDVSHIVTYLEMEGDDMVAEIEMLDTRAGKAFAERTSLFVEQGSIGSMLPFPYIEACGDGEAGDDRVYTKFRISTIDVWPPEGYVFDEEIVEQS